LPGLANSQYQKPVSKIFLLRVVYEILKEVSFASQFGILAVE
jgi:hypothetical protein